MKHSDVKLSSLITYADCVKAISMIEMNFQNVVGGSKAFFSGRATELTDAAKKKVAAIEKKMDAFEFEGDDE